MIKPMGRFNCAAVVLGNVLFSIQVYSPFKKMDKKLFYLPLKITISIIRYPTQKNAC